MKYLILISIALVGANTFAEKSTWDAREMNQTLANCRDTYLFKANNSDADYKDFGNCVSSKVLIEGYGAYPLDELYPDMLIKTLCSATVGDFRSLEDSSGQEIYGFHNHWEKERIYADCLEAGATYKIDNFTFKSNPTEIERYLFTAGLVQTVCTVPQNFADPKSRARFERWHEPTWDLNEKSYKSKREKSVTYGDAGWASRASCMMAAYARMTSNYPNKGSKITAILEERKRSCDRQADVGEPGYHHHNEKLWSDCFEQELSKFKIDLLEM